MPRAFGKKWWPTTDTMSHDNSFQRFRNPIKSPSKLVKSYFDDPTLSDLKIILSDRSVHVHRVVLCRGSEYFSKLLTGRFQESESKEITLHEDDPDAMFALLRFLYDLPYISSKNTKWSRNTLQPHALVYVVADKYQIKALQSETCENMRRILTSMSFLEVVENPDDDQSGKLKNGSDFVGALQTITAGTTEHDTQARKLMIDFVLLNIETLRKADEFLVLLRESPSLGAELIGHQDFECRAKGSWHCGNTGCRCCPEGTPTCKACGSQFKPETVRKNRYNVWWPCLNPSCMKYEAPTCKKCKIRVHWQPDNGPLRTTPWQLNFGSVPLSELRG